MSLHNRSEYVISFLEKMTYDIRQKNPALAKRIQDYFEVIPPREKSPEGLENVSAELGAVEDLASKGKADLSKIQIEAIIIDVVKQKFPPPQRAK